MQRSSSGPIRWTNQSVLEFAGESDPITAIENKAREVTLRAFDMGWTGPPFDPLRLADILNLRVSPRADIADARTIPSGKRPLIEFNPNRPRGRVRFSLAHEIAHTFFDDFSAAVRYRTHQRPTDDSWQLELLCNVAAAEIIMPIGSFRELTDETLTIEQLIKHRQRYDVSMEAILIRAAKLARDTVAAFCASANAAESGERYELEYVIPSGGWTLDLKGGVTLPCESVVTQCTGIGFTAKGTEKWQQTGPRWHIESVGIPPYPNSYKPRVAGIIRSGSRAKKGWGRIERRYGDALSPGGAGPKVIAHVVNDRTPNWGGNGFAAAVRRKWPHVQDDFRKWTTSNSRNLRLGNVHITDVAPNLHVAHMVAQKGFGSSMKPRIRYAALQDCLEDLGHLATEIGATIHMPLIGTGHAGGSWTLISELIERVLGKNRLKAFVYQLPPRYSSEKESIREGMLL